MALIAIGLSVFVMLDINSGEVLGRLLSGEVTLEGVILIVQSLQILVAILAIVWVHSINATLNDAGFSKRGLFRSFELPFESIDTVEFVEKRGISFQGTDGNHIALNDIRLDDSDAIHRYIADKLEGRDDIVYEERGGIFWNTESEVKEIYC